MRMMVLIGAFFGALLLLCALLVQSAQQQAALAGMACASAILPYVLFRLQSTAIQQDQLDKITELLRQGKEPVPSLEHPSQASAAAADDRAPDQGGVALARDTQASALS